MLSARKERYIEALNRLARDGYVNVVSLILSVPIERRNKPLLDRRITGNGTNGYKTKERPTHGGIDFNAGPHAEGYAPEVNFLAEGAKCTRSEFNSSYGNVVDITATIPHRVRGKAGTRMGKVTFRYAHLHNRKVKKGDSVPLWAELGKVGQTGNAHGAHLHFEVWVDGKRINPHDLDYLAPTLDKPTTHVVQKGETYGKISVRYGVSIADLRKWNGWPDTEIPTGAIMWLVEPPAESVPDPAPPERPDEPPHPVEPEPVISLEEFEQLKQQVQDIEAKLAAVKKAL